MPKIISYAKILARFAKDGKRGWKSVSWNTFLSKLKRTGPLLPPIHVTIEPANLCNIKCPVCETGKGEMTRTAGMMDTTAYRRFVDENWKSLNTMFFYFMGEPFLHKDAYEMIRYARNKGINVETCTNGDYMDPQGVIYSDINVVNVQIGGMDNETHAIYRVGSSLDKVKKNLELLLEERRRYPESNVKIIVGFIVMKHNEHQVEAFKRWGGGGADVAQVISPCVRTVEEGQKFLPENRDYWIYNEAEFNAGRLKPLLSPGGKCPWIWNSIVINWNGDAVACCRDPLGTNVLGNVFEEGLARVFNGEKAKAFRKAVMEHQELLPLCRLCPGEGIPGLYATSFPKIKE